MNKQFTTDWFSNNIPNWDIVLQDHKNQPNLNFLEILYYFRREIVKF